MDKEIVDKIVEQVKDDDLIKQSAFLFFSLLPKFSVEESIEATKVFVNDNGWKLNTDDKEFLETVKQRSLRDIEKWIDVSLRKT